jgi:hypothetical protein
MTRALLACLAVSVFTASAAGQTTDSRPKARPKARPNILFAFADDWGRYASAYAKLEPGGPSDVVKTPHFDRAR